MKSTMNTPAPIQNTSFFSLSRSATPIPDAATVSPVQASGKPTIATASVPDGHAPAQHKTLTNFGLLAKRSVSATGLSRRSSSRDAVPSGLGTERTISEAGQPRSGIITDKRQISNGPTANGAEHPVAAKGLMMALLHPNRSTASPAPTPLASPSLPPVPSLGSNIDGSSHISRVSARLSELINRILPAPGTSDAHGCVVVRGRCSARQDKAKELGDLIYHELTNAANDQYLLRTLLRSAVSKSLSVLLSRFEGLILAFVNDSSALVLPKTTRDAQTIIQRFNVENVKAAFEVRAAFDKVANHKEVPIFARDACLPWIVRFDTLIGQIVNPLLVEVKKSVGAIISRARDTLHRSQSNTTLPPAASAQNGLRSSSVLLDVVIGQPLYLVELAQQLEAALVLLRSLNCGTELDKWIVGIATFLTWKGMLAFAARPCPGDSHHGDDHSRPQARKALSSRSRTALPLLRTTAARRSPSPPHEGDGDAALHAMIKEVAAFRALVTAFAKCVCQIPHSTPSAKEEVLNRAETVKELCELFNLLPELDSDNEDEDLVHEAMHEALLALGSFELTLRALKWPEEVKLAFLYDDDDSSSSDDEANPRLTPSNVFKLVGPASPAARVAVEKAKKSPIRIVPAKLPDPTLDRALDTMPPLITFHLLASRLPSTRCEGFRLPHEIWKLPGGWDEYASQLAGFSSGESFAEEVGWQMVSELDRLKTDEMDTRDGHSTEGAWEELLRVAVAAECGD